MQLRILFAFIIGKPCYNLKNHCQVFTESKTINALIEYKHQIKEYSKLHIFFYMQNV